MSRSSICPHLGHTNTLSCSFISTFSPQQLHSIVRRLKQLSTNELWEKQSEHLQKYYWKKKILWSKGYFCSTVGEASEETIEKYIENKG